MKALSLYITIAALLSLLLVQSCNKTSKTGISSSEVLQEKEMVKVLTDLYLAEGLLGYPPVRGEFSEKDSTENYNDVIKSHGYTKEEVDRSIRYYFIDRPGKYEEIYNRVIENLSGMEADVIKEMSETTSVDEELWDGERSYSLPDVGVNDPVEFSIPAEGPGVYIIKARITLYPDDQSINPHSSVHFWYDDGTEEGKIIPWEKRKLAKSGRPVSITMRASLDDPRVTHIKGRLLNHSAQRGHWEKHAIITNISVRKMDEEKSLLKE